MNQSTKKGLGVGEGRLSGEGHFMIITLISKLLKELQRKE